MTNKKNQHFVPQFYLKRFSENMNSSFINLFNSKTERFISKAAIKHQAAIKHFYDKDGTVEDNLAIIENETAKTITKLSKSNSINHENSISKCNRLNDN